MSRLGGIVAGFIAIVLVALFFMSTVVIGQGQGGVVYNRTSGIEETALGQGWHIVHPMERVTEYNVSTETVAGNEFSVQTKDGKPLTIQISYDYMNEFDKLPAIYNKFKGQDSETIEDGWMQTRLKKAALGVFSQYSVLEVFQKQGEINLEIEKIFKESVEPTGFLVDSVTLGAPAPDAKTAEAIQAVVDASQKLEAMEIETEQAKEQAKKHKVEAEGKAQALKISSEAEAKANEIINKSISGGLTEYKSMEKWDGKLPQVTGGSTPMVTIPNGSKEGK
jgi:prohibitin 1